eukprot:5461413-Pleurochrysis_carterae.AAC.1
MFSKYKVKCEKTALSESVHKIRSFGLMFTIDVPVPVLAVTAEIAGAGIGRVPTPTHERNNDLRPQRTLVAPT